MVQFKLGTCEAQHLVQEVVANLMLADSSGVEVTRKLMHEDRVQTKKV
jgi:hypothetical protein